MVLVDQNEPFQYTALTDLIDNSPNSSIGLKIFF
jgi:hypothetical protein